MGQNHKMFVMLGFVVVYAAETKFLVRNRLASSLVGFDGNIGILESEESPSGNVYVSGEVATNADVIVRNGETASSVRGRTSSVKMPDEDCRHRTNVALANYRSGKADLWFYHITHHAGTTVRLLAEHNGLKEKRKPDQGCGGKFIPVHDSNILHMWGETSCGPGGHLPATSLTDHLPCRSDNFVSMTIWRHPLSRIISGDGSWTTTATEHVDRCNTDNYGLRWLIGKSFSEQLTEADLIFAKHRLDMFDIILIVENITQTSKMLCRDLGWKNCAIQQKRHTHASQGAAVPPDILRRWTERNYYEIQLYEYAVKKSNAMMTSRGPLLEEKPDPSMVKPLSSIEYNLDIDEELDMRWIC